MMVSTKGRYALRVMIDLAQGQKGQYISLSEIACRQEISEKYLESIISHLTKAGFVKAARGKKGGYMLTKEPKEYTVGSILRLTEISLAPVACLDCESPECERASECKTLPMWRELDRIINEYLDNVTLEDLVNTPTAGGYAI